MKDQIEKKSPKNLKELRQYIWEARDIISLDIQVNLMDSIYARFQRCIELGGKLVR